MGWHRVSSAAAKVALRSGRAITQARSHPTLRGNGNAYFHVQSSAGDLGRRPWYAGSRGLHSTREGLQQAAAPMSVPLSKLTDNFLDGTSSVYLEELQRAWEVDPKSVDESWDTFFRNFTGQAASNIGLSGQTIQESMRLLLLVRAYQVNGHMKAMLDPLGLDDRKIPLELDPALYGFTEADLDREFFLGVWRMSGFLSENRPVQTLREILNRCVCLSLLFDALIISDSWILRVNLH